MTSPFFDDLPESVQEIADVIGTSAALRLVCQLPSRYRSHNDRSRRVIMYVPKRLRPDHRLVEILGFETARKLVDAFGGEIMYPANCRFVFDRYRDEAIVRMIDEGARVEVVACLFGMTERHVRNITRKN